MSFGIWSGFIGVFGGALCWLASFKIIAIWIGPDGVALFSQLRQIAQAATISATLGGSNPVVQGIADRKNELARRQFRATASRIVALAGAGVVLAILGLAPQLSAFFLSSDAPALVATLRSLALAVLLNVGATYTLGVLNGYRSYSYLALAQISGPVALLMLLTGFWWWAVPYDPQLLAGSFVLCFGVTYLLGAWGVSRLPPFAKISGLQVLTNSQSRIFLKFALSSLAAALFTTIALLLIRSWMIESRGLAFAGLFDAGWTLTFNYITLFLTACSAIYLPLLTAATHPEEQRAYILKTAYLVVGVSILICYAMVLLRQPLINLLYSPQFQASSEVLMVLVIAVMFRGVSWVYGTMIIATRNSRVLLFSDLTFNLCLLGMTRYALETHTSLEALSWAFVLPNFLYLVFVVEYVRKKNPFMRRRLIWPLVVASTLPLVYLAMAPGGPQRAHSGLALWLCMVIGLAVSSAALVAYKKVTP